MSHLKKIDYYDSQDCEGRAFDKELELLMRIALQRTKARRADVIELGKVANGRRKPQAATPPSGSTVVDFPLTHRNPVEGRGAVLPQFRSNGAEPVAEIRLGNLRLGLLKGPENIFRDEFA